MGPVVVRIPWPYLMPVGKKFKETRSFSLSLILSLATACVPKTAPALAAEDLKLRPGISFTQDLDTGFPIVATKMDDVKIEVGVPAIIFFGASGDLNTNRQAKRLVDLYERVDQGTVKFIVIDVDHATSDDAKKLIKSYYRGYIPFEVILDKNGKVEWSQIGEVDMGVLKHHVSQVI